jgi:hypothetical protein
MAGRNISTLDRNLRELFHGLEVLTGLFKEPLQQRRGSFSGFRGLR